MTAATQVLWRVQYRLSRTSKWRNGGLYETREAARHTAAEDRTHAQYVDCKWTGYGFGNTRVVRYVKAKKEQRK